MSGGNQPADASSAISYGWKKFTENWQTIILAVLVGFIAVVVLWIIGFFIWGAIVSGDTTCTQGSFGKICTTDSPGAFATLFGVAILGFLVFVGQFIIGLIVIRASLILTSGGQLDRAALLSMENLGPYVVASLLVAVMAAVGLMLCVIPGILVLFFTAFYGFFVLDKNMKPMDAIKASFELVRDNVGQVLLFFLLSWVVNFIGQLACGVGVLVSWPVVIIATGYMYKRLQGEPVAA